MIVTLMAVCMVLPGHQCYAQEGYDYYYRPLDIEMVLGQMIYRLDEEIKITVYLKNNTDEALEILEPAIDQRSLFFDITLPGGKKEKLIDIFGLSLDRITLPRGKRVKFTTEFSPEVVGTYELKVSYRGFAEQTISSDHLTVFVVNPSPAPEMEDLRPDGELIQRY